MGRAYVCAVLGSTLRSVAGWLRWLPQITHSSFMPLERAHVCINNHSRWFHVPSAIDGEGIYKQTAP